MAKKRPPDSHLPGWHPYEVGELPPGGRAIRVTDGETTVIVVASALSAADQEAAAQEAGE